MLEQIESSIIAFLLGSTLTYFGARWSKILKKIDCLEMGMQAILRDRMTQMHKYYLEKKNGFIFGLFFFFEFVFFLILFFNFTIFYWFCHISK